MILGLDDSVGSAALAWNVTVKMLVLVVGAVVAGAFPGNSQIDEFSLIVFHFDGSCVVKV